MAKDKATSLDIELAVVNLIGYRQNTIVPNVSWGLGLNHECDLLVLDSKNRFTEVEIKVTLSDLKADFNKHHNHSSKIISRMFYAFPKDLLEKALPLIPTNIGIITCEPGVYYYGKSSYSAKYFRMVRHDKYSRPSERQIQKFMNLGCMRIWSLKHHLFSKI
jgi:hypothetical protein